MSDYDVCIVGSGAGASPVAFSLSQAGYKVLILEKGPWFTEKDFSKDELGCCRRSTFTPKLWEEQHVIEEEIRGEWQAESTFDSGWDFWNGNCVGGSSNFMSGFFHRLKPNDFKLLSTYGPIEGANIADWPISYEDLEPYYAMVEEKVGVSGKVVQHPQLEPRSTADFPFPPTQEHPISKWIDKSCANLNLHPLPVARAILSQPAMGRSSCTYTNYCGSYGCHTGAKGSGRAALLNHAVATGNCEIRPHSKAYKISSDSNGKISSVEYYDLNNQPQTVDAKIYVVACQAIETSRLLLASTGPKHPNGLANNNDNVGKNLIFSAGGVGTGDFSYNKLSNTDAEALKTRGLFVNRSLQDWYEIENADFSTSKNNKLKGGTVDFLFRHANPIARANSQKSDNNGQLLWGRPLQKQLKSYFTEARYLQFEVFNDWLPTDNCFVSLDKKTKDKWGDPVARVRIGAHSHDLKVGRYLADKSETVLAQMGAENIRSSVSDSPPPNLVAGGCRFGNDPESSVLDANCHAHDVENLYVTDGSFMPTGGSVPYTWTIYANAFRVADKIKQKLN